MSGARGLAVLAAALASAVATSTAPAQGPDSAHTLPWEIAAEAAYRYNLPAALRAQGATTIAAGRVIDGNVAVRDGALVIGGTVHGSVVLINGSAELLAGARVDSDVVVVGGALSRSDSAAVGGRVIVRPEPLLYRMQGELLVATRDSTGGELSWFRRWQTRYDAARTKFALRAGTYDRVEGLPVMAGLTLRRTPAVGQISVTALGIYRSVNNFEWTRANRGYDVTAELQRGRTRGVAFGVRAFDVVDAVEDWQLSSTELSLFSFVARHDDRDYFNDQGGSAWAALIRGATRVTLAYTQSWWGVRAAQNPLSLFNADQSWRANPVLDAGLLRRASLALAYDTRNNADDPWTGWLVNAEDEVGRTSSLTNGPTSDLARANLPSPAAVTYQRGWLDLRRYDRVSPQGHLNVRLVLGTQLGGGALPLERRFSMGGEGSLAGYEFRQLVTPDVFTCSDVTVPAGQPAQCARLALAQAEYRADFTLRLFPYGGERAEARSHRIDQAMSWVLFTDAGRGWLLGATADGVRYGSWTMPPLYTFRTDVGAGVDLRWLGLYLAKSLTDWPNPVRAVVRLQHQF